MIITKNVKNAILQHKLQHKYGKLHYVNKNDYYEFKSIDDAEQWGRKKYQKWADWYKKIFVMMQQYPEGSILRLADPLKAYFGDRYQEINDLLRQNKSMEDALNVRVIITNLLFAIFSAPTIDSKVILYRQVPQAMVTELITLNKKDLPYREEGFLSACMLKNVCAKNCGHEAYMLKLYVDDFLPIHAIYANVIWERDEEELLLPPELNMRMINYPYRDNETTKTIIEVQIFSEFMGVI